MDDVTMKPDLGPRVTHVAELMQALAKTGEDMLNREMMPQRGASVLKFMEEVLGNFQSVVESIDHVDNENRLVLQENMNKGAQLRERENVLKEAETELKEDQKRLKEQTNLLQFEKKNQEDVDKHLKSHEQVLTILQVQLSEKANTINARDGELKADEARLSEVERELKERLEAASLAEQSLRQRQLTLSEKEEGLESERQQLKSSQEELRNKLDGVERIKVELAAGRCQLDAERTALDEARRNLDSRQQGFQEAQNQAVESLSAAQSQLTGALDVLGRQLDGQSEEIKATAPKLETVIETLGAVSNSLAARSQVDSAITTMVTEQVTLNKKLQYQQDLLVKREQSDAETKDRQKLLSAERGDLITKVSELQAQLVQVTNDTQAKDEHLKELENQLKEAYHAHAANTKEVEQLDSRCEALDKRHNEDMATIGALREKVKTAEGEESNRVTKLEEELKAAREKLAGADSISSLNRTVQEVRSELVEAIGSAYQGHNALIEEKNQAIREKEDLETQIREYVPIKVHLALQTKMQELHEKNVDAEQLRTRISELQGKLSGAEHVASTCKEHEKLGENNRSLIERQIALEIEVSTVKAQLSEAQYIASTCKDHEKLAEINRSLVEKQEGLLHDITDLKAQLSEAQHIASTCKDHQSLADINRSLVERQECFLHDITDLKAQLSEAEHIASTCKDHGKLEEANSDLTEKLEGLLRDVTHLNAELSETRMIASTCKDHERLIETNAKLVERQEELLKRVDETQQLAKQIGGLENQLKEAGIAASNYHEHQSLATTNASLIATDKDLRAQLSAAQEEVWKCKNELLVMKGKLEETLEAGSALSAENTILLREKSDLVERELQKSEEAASKCRSLEEERKALLAERTTLLGKSTHFQDQLQAAENKLEEFMAAASKCGDLEKEKKALGQERTALLRQNKELLEKVIDQQQLINLKTSILEKELQQSKEVSSKCQSLEEACNALVEEKAKILMDVHKKMSQFNELKEKITTLSQENSKLVQGKGVLQGQLIAAQNLALRCQGHETLSKQVEDLKEKLANYQGQNTLKADLTKTQNDLERMKEKMLETRIRNTELASEKSSLENNLKLALELSARCKGHETLEKDMEAAVEASDGLRQQLIQANDNLLEERKQLNEVKAAMQELRKERQADSPSRKRRRTEEPEESQSEWEAFVCSIAQSMSEIAPCETGPAMPGMDKLYYALSPIFLVDELKNNWHKFIEDEPEGQWFCCDGLTNYGYENVTGRLVGMNRQYFRALPGARSTFVASFNILDTSVKTSFKNRPLATGADKKAMAKNSESYGLEDCVAKRAPPLAAAPQTTISPRPKAPSALRPVQPYV
ncbi:hypothetical protein QBC44DRAFT_372378 [Cladorrhinum sp. PSN332]|nr:hypothetical protein QBC44DRAFT_372378 [Cladorrhinum sp. PSN332]